MKILNKIIEAGANINRLKKHINDNVPFLIGTAYRGQFSNNVNIKRNKDFIIKYVKPLGLSFIQIKGKWKEENQGNVAEERSFMIMGNIDGSDDKKIMELAKILVKNPNPSIPEAEQEAIPTGDKVGYNQEAVVVKLTDSPTIFLYEAGGRISKEDGGDIGDGFDKHTEEEIYSTIKNNDFTIKKLNLPIKELLELEVGNLLTLNKKPYGMAGNLKQRGILETLD